LPVCNLAVSYAYELIVPQVPVKNGDAQSLALMPDLKTKFDGFNFDKVPDKALVEPSPSPKLPVQPAPTSKPPPPAAEQALGPHVKPLPALCLPETLAKLQASERSFVENTDNRKVYGPKYCFDVAAGDAKENNFVDCVDLEKTSIPVDYPTIVGIVRTIYPQAQLRRGNATGAPTEVLSLRLSPGEKIVAVELGVGKLPHRVYPLPLIPVDRLRNLGCPGHLLCPLDHLNRPFRLSRRRWLGHLDHQLHAASWLQRTQRVLWQRGRCAGSLGTHLGKGLTMLWIAWD
jgi:hypothetical protein